MIEPPRSLDKLDRRGPLIEPTRPLIEPASPQIEPVEIRPRGLDDLDRRGPLIEPASLIEPVEIKGTGSRRARPPGTADRVHPHIAPPAAGA